MIKRKPILVFGFTALCLFGLALYAHKTAELARVGQFRIFVSKLKKFSAELTDINFAEHAIGEVDFSETDLDCGSLSDLFKSSFFCVQRLIVPDSFSERELEEIKRKVPDALLVEKKTVGVTAKE